MPSLSPAILSILLPFASLFSRPAWNNALTLLVGTILCRGKRTVCAALRVMGLNHNPNFSKYHHVLNRVVWSPLQGSKILLNILLKLMGKDKPLVMFIDETLERRKGPKIKARGYYRDAVRSSKGVVVKTSGLKWLTLAISWKFPFSARYFALPFMTTLEPSKKSTRAAKKRHKTTLQWTIQMIKQVMSWISKMPFILVGDGGFACIELAWTCLRCNGCLISRLKINSCLYDFPPPDRPGKRGRKRKRGAKLYSFKKMLQMQDLGWQSASIQGYGKKDKQVRYLSNTALWGPDGFPPVPIRWVLVVDPERNMEPLPLMCTDVTLSVERIIELYVQRWNLEVTFEEVREHLGVETQRQWSDKAIARTTPVLMGLYTFVCLIAHRMHEEKPIEVAQTAWYEKKDATFSDLLKAVRKVLWKDNLIFRKCIFTPFPENNASLNEVVDSKNRRTDAEVGWVKLLVECLAAA